MESGLNHFFSGKNDGWEIMFTGKVTHLRGYMQRAWLEGRITDEQVENFEKLEEMSFHHIHTKANA